jgi:MFS family permease
VKLIRNRNVWLLSLAQAFHLSAAVTAIAVVSLLGIRFAPEPAMATIPNALLTVGVALSTVPFSFFMKRYSRKSGFLLGSAFGVLSFSLGLYAVYSQSFLFLCTASFLQGIYQASVLYYRFAAAEAVAEKDKSIAISMVLAGSIFAALLAPTAAREATQYMMPVEFAGAYSFMFLVALLSFIPLSFLKHRNEREDESVEGGERPLAIILRQPKTVCAIAANVAAWSSMVFLMSAVPLAMLHEGFGFEHSSLVIQWHVLGMYVPSLFSGFLIARYGNLRILGAGIASLGAAIVTAFSGFEVINFALTLVFVGMGWNFMYVAGTTLLTEVHNDAERAKVQGMNEFTGFGITAAAAAASGAILEYFGWHGLLFVEIGILVFILLVVLWYAGAVESKREFESP